MAQGRGILSSVLGTQYSVLAVVGLAFVLGLYRLAGPSLRGDETFSYQLAVRSLRDIFAALRASEPNPPLYYLALHTWLRFAGGTDFALRFFSLWFFVPLAALAYRMAAVLVGGVARPLLAAAFVAMSPFLLWHAQDGRNYTMLTAFCLPAVWATLRVTGASRASIPALKGGAKLSPALQGGDGTLPLQGGDGTLPLQGGGRRSLQGGNGSTILPLLVYAFSAELALLTHYAAVFLIVALNVVALASLRSRRLVAWILVQAAVGLVYLPWVVYVREMLLGHSKDWIASVGPFELVRRLLVAYGLGSAVDPALAGWLVLPFAAGLIAGGVVLLRLPGGWRALVLLALPVAIVGTISVARPMFDERYLVYGAALSAPVVAAGLAPVGGAGWTRAVRAAVLVLVVGSVAVGLYGHYADPRFAKSPQWRELGRAVVDRRQEGDLLLLTYPDRSAEFYVGGLVPSDLLPESFPIDAETTVARLSALPARRVWLVPVRAPNWDPDGFVERWLDLRWKLVDEVRFPTAPPLKLYVSPTESLATLPPRGEVSFDGRIALVGYALSPARPLHAGESLAVDLYFRALRPVGSSFKVYNHLLDPAGKLRGQADSVPAQNSYPTDRWRPGEIVLDRYLIPTAPDAPPGEYTLRTGFYEPGGGKRLPVVSSDGRPVGDGAVIPGVRIETR